MISLANQYNYIYVTYNVARLGRIRLRRKNEVAMMVDAGVGIRYANSARKNPRGDTILYAVANEWTTAVTL